MIEENETSPSVFTDAGEQWVAKMSDALRSRDYDRVGELGCHKSWGTRGYGHGKVPETHPKFGRLIDPYEEPQYLLMSAHVDSQDVTEKDLPGSDPRHSNPIYRLEHFGKVRIYCEAVARNVEHLFAPITGWDGHDFRWITMPELSNIQRSDGGTSKADHLKRKLKEEDENWVIHDEEVGEYKGDEVLLDYGMFWYDGDWKVLESELLD